MSPVIRLRFVAERGFVSRVIRWFGGDLGFSHVGAISDDGRYELGARSTVDRALGRKPGVQLRPEYYARFTDELTIAIPCTPAEHRAFWAALNSQLGKPYSARTIFGLFGGFDCGRRGEWICSALVAWGLYRARILAPRLHWKVRQLTPNEVYALAEQIAHGRQHVVNSDATPTRSSA